MIHRSIYLRVLISWFLLTGVYYTSYAFAKKPTTINLMLLDTIGRASVIYEPFIKQSSDAGFTITYVAFDQFVDAPQPEEQYKNFQGYLFAFGLDFLIGLQEQSPLSKKIMQFFQHCVTKHDHLIGLFFPPLNMKPDGISMVNKFAPFFKPLINESSLSSMLLPSKQLLHRTTIEHFLQLADEFLSKPLISRPCSYHTTLQAPRQGVPFFNPRLRQILQLEQKKLTTLPTMPPDSSSKYAAAVNHMLPFGLYWFNPVHTNHVFITSTNAITLTSIKEDFHLCPVNTAIRDGMYNSVGMMMQELRGLLMQNSTENKISFKKKHIKKKQRPQKMIAHKIATKEKTAWMEIVMFQEPLKDQPTLDTAAKQEQERQQDLLIDYIFKAGLDTLWISITPNILYSPIAREKHREQQILQAISRFTQKLSTHAQTHNKQLPKICVGFEITNNIYDPNLPATPAVDLYGSVYPDLPCPLSKQFWHNEIVTSFKTFVHHWQNPAISHGITLSGIVIDLEMYCRRKSGTFLETMGFDKPTFARYMKKHKATYSMPSTPHEMITTLGQHQECQQYFVFLENEAEALGKKIQEQITDILPHAQIACYTPSILVDWFYKGFMKGLAHNQESLNLFTFNTLFAPHQDWFSRNSIPATHSSVLLLSKLQTPKDFKWVNHILNHHAGIWLNRFSRLVEKYDQNSWIGVEQTGMDESSKTAFLDYFRKQ